MGKSMQVPASVLRASVEDALEAARRRRELHEEELRKAKKAQSRADARARRHGEQDARDELSASVVAKARGRLHGVDGVHKLRKPVQVSPERILEASKGDYPPYVRRRVGFGSTSPGAAGMRGSRADATSLLQPAVAEQRKRMEHLKQAAAPESPTRAASGLEPRDQSQLSQQAIRLGAAGAQFEAERAATDLKSALQDPAMDPSPGSTPGKEQQGFGMAPGSSTEPRDGAKHDADDGVDLLPPRSRVEQKIATEADRAFDGDRAERERAAAAANGITIKQGESWKLRSPPAQGTGRGPMSARDLDGRHAPVSLASPDGPVAANDHDRDLGVVSSRPHSGASSVSDGTRAVDLARIRALARSAVEAASEAVAPYGDRYANGSFGPSDDGYNPVVLRSPDRQSQPADRQRHSPSRTNQPASEPDPQRELRGMEAAAEALSQGLVPLSTQQPETARAGEQLIARLNGLLQQAHELDDAAASAMGASAVLKQQSGRNRRSSAQAAAL